MILMNINRDYLIILDVKSGEVDSPNIYYFNTDKNTSNLYVQMVMRETTVDVNPIENAVNYSIKANILKPNMVGKEVEGVLVNEIKAIYEFKLPADCTDFSGNAKIEFEVYTEDKIATSFATKFKVNGSILTEQNKYIEDSSDYPILKELMAEVKVINETAHELDTTIRTLQADMIDANEEMKTNEVTRQANETTRVANEEARVEAERTRVNQEATRVEAEAIREGQEATRVANEDERKAAENQRKANEEVRASNENERKANEASRVSAENARVANEEERQTNEANRETAEEIRKANEQARIAEHEAMRTEHEQTMTAVNEVKAENAVLMENDKKIADRMTQVEISDKRQYVIMEGLMNSAGDGYLKIEDTGNDTTLYNSVEGFVDVKNITGNTMVNSIKNPDDELTLNADINTSGQSVTLTTAVDNGQVDVLAEGNTMVNVCDQQEAVAITKSYTVETGNHVALQGEFDGKARPVPTGNTLVNIVNSVSSTEVRKGNSVNILLNYSLLQDKDYTIKFTIESKIGSQPLKFRQYNVDGGTVYNNNLDFNKDQGTYMVKLTPTVEFKRLNFYYDSSASEEEYSCVITNIVVLEGDYTNKPIPDYFEGMQSSFEDKVVTQEMVDSGTELAENLGKYRVDYKVTGKNKVNMDNMYFLRNNYIETYHGIPLHKNTDYKLSFDVDNGAICYDMSVRFYDENMKRINTILGSTNTFNSGNASFLGFHLGQFTHDNGSTFIDLTTINNIKIQLEEGSTATPYEPYKESIKTYYLNSPLLEGDTIEESNGNVYHVHRYGKVVLDGSENWAYWNSNTDYGGLSSELISFYLTMVDRNYIPSDKGSTLICDKFMCDNSTMWGGTKEGIALNADSEISLQIAILRSKLSSGDLVGFKQWLQQNPTTIVYKLASPTYELISQNDTILTDSYVAGHLDFDTAVPVEKVVFNEGGWIKLRYLYPSTEYIIQFESDNIGKIDNLRIGNFSNTIANINIVKGLNKININTNDSVSDGLMIRGIGFSASNIVVTEATDKDFGYFSGMKSVGELEENKIEILSSNKNLVDWSTLKTYGIKDTDIVQNDNNGFIFRATAWNVGVKLYADIRCFCKNSYYKISTSLPDGADRLCPLSDILYLDNDKNVLGKVNNNKSMIYTDNIPANAKYIRLFFKNYTNDETKTNGLSSVQIEKVSDSNGTNTAYIPHASNKKQILLNEPLRAVGDTKDRFVQIDGKWYVERNCAEVVLDGDESWSVQEWDNMKRFQLDISFRAKGSNAQCICDKFVRDENDIAGKDYVRADRYMIYFYVKDVNKTLDTFKNEINYNPITVIYELETPTYEPVEIAPTVNTYTDVTHITNNSTIPMNMPIVNSGYEVIAKPSTKYTVVGIDSGRIGDSTIVNGTITTPATITDNFLRPYGTGKVSKVMLLEGEPANIPGYFEGIKSVFEDKVTEDGKYACEVRVYNDLGNETVQTLYLDEPLYNTNNITIYNDKLGYWKNYDIRDYQDGDFGTYLTDMIKTVYQLAEPVFIPLIDNCPNWVISSWDNCSIHFDSIIPLKDTRYRYTGNVPSVVTMSEDIDTVSSISDEQDALLIDMATELAVMKLTM